MGSLRSLGGWEDGAQGRKRRGAAQRTGLQTRT